MEEIEVNYGYNDLRFVIRIFFYNVRIIKIISFDVW